jgi:hypothetical protein
MLRFFAFVAAASARTFTDDAGVTHETNLTAPTILAVTMDGLSLVHFGLSHEQLKATVGERATSGSNANGVYADGNINDHGDHANAGYDPRHFPADPNAAERAVLAHAVDLSPGCSNGNFWCVEFNYTHLDQIGWPDYIFQGAYGGEWPFNEYYNPGVTAAIEAAGVQVIQIGRADTTTGVQRGMIEMIERYEQVAEFLGVTDAAVNSAADKAQLCAAAESFKHIASQAHARGVRALGTYAPYLLPAANGTIGGWLYSPQQDMVLLMLEELGMPLLHLGEAVSTMFNADYTEGLMSASNLQSPDGVSLPVDLWLYDVRVTLDFVSEAFAAAWPHPAVTARQFAYWPSGGHIYSYVHAAEILTMVGNALAGAEALHEPTECTPTDGIQGTVHRTDGLQTGEYACYGPVEFAWCSAHSDLHASRTASDWDELAAAAGWHPPCERRRRKLAAPKRFPARGFKRKLSSAQQMARKAANKDEI